MLAVISNVSSVKAEISPTINNDKPACSNLIKECFQSEGSTKVSCLFISSKNPVCNSNAMGKLCYNRWAIHSKHSAYSPAEQKWNANQETSINQSCLKKFDEKWYNLIMTNDNSEETIEHLAGILEECKEKSELNTLQP